MTEPLGGRVLGIDYGSKRIGYAVSDELGVVVRPLEVWNRRGLKNDLAHAAELVLGHDVVRIVVGIPLRLDGSAGPAAERAFGFVEALRAALPTVRIDTRDETLTTWEAEQRLIARGVAREERKRVIDAEAAAVILEEELGEPRDGNREGAAPTRRPG